MFPCKHVLFDLQNQQSYSIWPLIQGLFPGSPFLFDSFHLFSDILISVIGMEKYPRIRELREDGDLSQAQVGRAVNLPQRTYAYYESGQRMAPQRPYESKVQILHIPVREVRGDRRGRHPSREKDSKTLVLAAFFPPFLSPQKERAPPEAFDSECGGGGPM